IFLCIFQRQQFQILLLLCYKILAHISGSLNHLSHYFSQQMVNFFFKCGYICCNLWFLVMYFCGILQ
uniref:Uncharacterized protein n=4 Tax=Cercopithecinae TaxID=9528 RepID=A0A2K5L3I6_CERAT